MYNLAKNLFYRILTAILGICCLLPIGCSGKQGDPNVIKIVSSLPRTGSAQGQTDAIVNGIKMAIEEAGSKVGQFTITYQDKDDATAQAGQWDAGAETTNAKDAVADPDVMVYIGTLNSGAAKISMPILNRANLLMISPANTAVGLTKPSDEKGEPDIYRPTGKLNFARVVPTDDLQGPLGAEWAKSMGLKSVYVLDDNEMYGNGLAKLFAKHCEEIGIKVLGHEQINVKENDFTVTLRKIKNLEPELIYFGGTSQSKGGQIAKDMNAVGLQCKMMAPDGCMEHAFIDAAGESNVNDRCFITFPGMLAKDLEGDGKKFYENYVAKFKKEPEPYAVYGYESGKAALMAIRNAGKKNREEILKAAFALKDVQGVHGVWSFDENGDTTLKKMSGHAIKNGKFEFVKVLEFAPKEK